MSTTAAAEASGLQVEALPRDGREPALELVSSGPAPRFLFLH